MRKFIALAIAFCLSLSLVACGGGEDTTKAPEETKAPVASNDKYEGFGYTLTIDGKDVQIGMSGEDLVALLGETSNVFEAPSCAGQGIDYTYTYAGGSVEITAQPYNYYTVADVKVNGESVGAVSSYTIENITGPVAVDVSFRHANSFIDAGGQDERDDSESESDLGWGAGYAGQSLLFRDVYPWHPAYSAISFVTDRGLMNGVGGGLFDPDNGVTRAMMATILWRMEGQPAAYGDTGFSDVPAGQWYSDAVYWGAENGVIQGYPDNTFRPDAVITREDLITLLYRYSGMEAPDSEKLAEFADAADVSHYAVEAMEWAITEGIIEGYLDNTLKPQATTNRAELATLLVRFYERYVMETA